MNCPNNPYKKVKIGHHMLVVVHMPNDPSCVCAHCLAAAELDGWHTFLTNNPDSMQFDAHPDNQPPFPQDPTPPSNPATAASPGNHGPSTPRRAASCNRNFAADVPNGIPTPPSLVTPERPIKATTAPIGGMLVPVTFGGSAAATEVKALCHTLRDAVRGSRFVQAKSHSFHTQSVVASASNPFAAASMQELEDLGFSPDAVVANTEQVFSPIVNDCFLGPMRHVGVFHLTTAADFCPTNETAEEMRMIDFNHKGCFFFVPLMMRNKTISLINNNNETEFNFVNGNKVVNRKFWSANLDIKRLNSGAGFFKTLEIGALVPEWTVAQTFLHKHRDAMEWMASNSAVLPNKTTFFLSLKQEHSTVFLRNMESEMVARARLAGFQPLFLMKNAIIQKTAKFGVNGTQVTTINVQPKSYLALVGFFKGKGNDLKIITIKNEQDNFMVIDNNNNN